MATFGCTGMVESDMINPETITNYNQTDAQLEEFILFWVCAAGKNGRTAARCLDNLLWKLRDNFSGTPFQLLRRADHLMNLPALLQFSGIGCFNAKARSFRELIWSDIDLKTCTVDDLESIYGIGMKTARCFLIHSREGIRLAGIDTHLLKHLKAVGVENVPSSTPGNKKEYLRLEQEFLRLADEAGKEPAVFDLEIWNRYSVKSTAKEMSTT